MTRYYWSICHRYFQITPSEWTLIVQGYVLNSVAELRKVCLRQYCKLITISQRPGHLWSKQLNEPLSVWSPWTLNKLCTVSCNRAFFRFREHRFVTFVQDIVHSFGLKSSAIRRGQSYRVCVCNYMVGEPGSNTNICVAQSKIKHKDVVLYLLSRHCAGKGCVVCWNFEWWHSSCGCM